MTLRIRSAGWLFATQVTSAAFAFAASVLLARVLGASGKGTVTVAITIAAIGGVLLAVGLPGGAGYLAAKKLLSARSGARLAWFAAIALTAIPLLTVALTGAALTQALLGDSSNSLVIVAVAGIAPTIAAQISASYLLGAGRVRSSSIVNTITASGSLLGWSALALAGKLAPETAILWWIFNLILGASALTYLVYNTRIDGDLNAIRAIRAGFRFGVASWVSSGLHLLSLRVDVFLLALLAGTTAVGVYSVGVALAEFAWYIPNAIYGVLFPKVAAEGEDARFLVAKLSRMIWPAVLLASFGIAAASYVLVPIVFGQAFSGAIGVAFALVPGATFAAVSSVLASYFAGTGRPVYAVVAPAANLAVNLVLNVFLIPSLGVLGAALASSASYGVGAAIMTYYFSRLTRVRVSSLLIPNMDDAKEFRSMVASLGRRANLRS